MFLRRWYGAATVSCALGLVAQSSWAAGSLTPIAGGSRAELTSHSVHVVLNNGFARTEVTQEFINRSSEAIDAIYEFPVPKAAALSEMSIQIDDRVMHGEVLAREQAQTIYDAQNSAGEQAGLATKDGYQNFRFRVSNISAGGQATLRFVYYEALTLDGAVGRYLYPLEDGGTRGDTSFWTGNSPLTGRFEFDLELKSTRPVEEVRIPGVDPEVTQLGDGHYTIRFERESASLNEDVVFYYRIPDSEGGRVDVMPYRSAAGGPGTFMLVLTPGIDLAPLNAGHDAVFVLDTSGSMLGKLETLVEAVAQSLDRLTPADRFRIVAFNDSPQDLTGGTLQASPEVITETKGRLRALASAGGTNLYDGLRSGLETLTPERVTQLILVTDGVTNEGIVEPREFDRVLREIDVRFVGLLLGNNANWPLMEVMTEASGGFYAPISNQDDVFGQILLADNKMTHESMFGARLEVTGVPLRDTTDFDFNKVYRGQQLVLFGRYDTPGAARVELSASVSGQPRSYGLDFELPATAEADPELERLWALEMIHALERQALLKLMSEAEAQAKIREIGVEYQLVTDETSMIVVDDTTFEELGIERRNQERTAIENGSSSGNPSSGSYDGSSGESYGGALDLWTALAALLSALGALALRLRSREQRARDASALGLPAREPRV